MRNSGDSRIGMLAFLGGTALALVALVAFARYPSLFRRGDEYFAVFRSVPGINLGDEVRYGGLLVGSITSLDLDPEEPTRIVVTFRVRKRTPIRTDTRASITQVGFLGQPYLNLAPGRREAPPLPEGSRVQSSESFTFQDAMTRLAIFLDRADTLLHGVERVAATSPWDRIDRTLAQLEALVGAASEGSHRVLGELESASRELNTVLARTERVMAAIDTSLRSAAPELASTQRELMATLRDMRVLVAELRDAAPRADRVDQIVGNLSVATANLARLSERLERDPTSVLKRQRPPAKPAGPAARE